MKKRTLTLLLAVLMLAQTLVGCSDATTETEDTKAVSTPNPTETTAPTNEEELSDYERRQLIPDDLPEVTYGGADFRVLTSDDGYGSKEYEIFSEELNGDACNDSVYNRNLDIESRFEVKIVCGTAESPHSQVNDFVKAGTNDYHIVGFFNYQSRVAIAGKSLYNWRLVPNVNLDKPWHNKLANDSATINGTLYAICSDLSISAMTYTYAFFFNVDKIQNYGVTAQNLYDWVKAGEWTLDKAIEVTNTMYEDINGDGKRDVNDQYGFGYEITNPADVWLTAFDQRVCEVQDQSIEIPYMSDKTISIYEKLLDWHYNGEGFYKYGTQYDEEKYFLTGNLMMAPLRFYAAYNKLREMEDVYSIVPYPKWNEDQTSYYTNADDKFTAFGFPLTSYNEMEFVGTIFEALSAESYKKVYPEYYDTALKGKYSSDPTTVEMIDLIMTGRNFDFSFQWGYDFQDLPYFLRNELKNEKSTFSSDYKKKEKAIGKNVRKKILPLYGVEA